MVLWTREISTELACQAVALGVRGVLRKTLPREMLLKCIRKVHSGEVWFEKELTASFFGAKTFKLTPREGQLIGLLAQGLKNKEIAAEMGLAEGTVKVYFSRLFEKVGAKDRFELALYGLKNMRSGNHLGGSGSTDTPLRSLVFDRPVLPDIASAASPGVLTVQTF